MFKFFKKQRGAMFGLDARIALSIFAGLSVVTGVSMIQILKDSRTDKILLIHDKVSDAFDLMQEDLEASPIDVLAGTGTNYRDLYEALDDATEIAASHRSKWRGPYLRDNSGIRDQESGYMLRIRPMSETSTGVVNCTATDQANGTCFYFLSFGDTTIPVPQKIKDDVNEVLDGTGEALPASEGTVRWDSEILFIKMGKAMRW